MTPRTLVILAATIVAVSAGAAWPRLANAQGSSRLTQPARGTTELAALTRDGGPARGSTARVVPPHRKDAALPRVSTTVESYNGIPATVSCATCHATLPRNLELGTGDTLPTQFHLGLKYSHGNQSCLSCHNTDNHDTLRLADGRAVPFAQAQQLCTQCHGTQTRDYVNGAHGGMTGYWDLQRGGRERNTCTDCHDPHAPAYPVFHPVFPPRDRGALQQAQRASTSGHASPPSTP